MSEKKESLRKWIAGKLSTRDQKIEEAGSETEVLKSYLIAFSAASQVLSATGAEEECVELIDTALDIISGDYQAAEERAAAKAAQEARAARLKSLLGE